MRNELVEKLKKGYLALSTRSAISKVFQIGSSLTLAYLLTPKDYGIFGIIFNFVSSLLYLTDIGIGDILMQNKEKPSKEEIATFWGIRLSLGLLWFIIFLIVSPLLVDYYNIEIPYASYVGIIALVLPLEATSAVSLLNIQRDLKFDKLAKIELYEISSLYLSQIIFAFLGLGVWSLIIANLIAQLVKLFLALSLAPPQCMPKLNFSLFRGRYQQGFFYQLNSIIPTSKGIMLPIVLSLFLDLDSMGVIFWVTSLVSLPMILAYNYNQVFFPALSKVQDDQNRAKDLASKSIEKMILILTFIFGLGGTAGESIIDLVFKQKWFHAKILIGPAAAYMVFSAIRILGNSILSAQGKPHVRTKIETYLIIVEYIFIYIGCKLTGAWGYFVGVGLAGLLSNIYMAYNVNTWLGPNTYKRFIFSIMAMSTPYLLGRYTGLSQNIFIASFGYCIIYFTLLYCIDKNFRELSFKIYNKLSFNRDIS